MKSPEKGPEGAWIEQCELRLQLPGKEPQTYRFGHYEPLPLNLSHVVRIAEELTKKVRVVKEKDEIPVDYEPRRGDVLKRSGTAPASASWLSPATTRGSSWRGSTSRSSSTSPGTS